MYHSYKKTFTSLRSRSQQTQKGGVLPDTPVYIKKSNPKQDYVPQNGPQKKPHEPRKEAQFFFPCNIQSAPNGQATRQWFSPSEAMNCKNRVIILLTFERKKLIAFKFPVSDIWDIQSSANKHTGFAAISFNFQDELSTESMWFHHSEKLDWFYLFWQRSNLNQSQIYLGGRRTVLKERGGEKCKHKCLLLAFLHHSHVTCFLPLSQITAASAPVWTFIG